MPVAKRRVPVPKAVADKICGGVAVSLQSTKPFFY